MADSISNGSENEEVTDQFSVWITRSQGTQTVAIALPSSPCRWTRAKPNAADIGMAPPYGLRHRCNLTSVSKVCDAAPISLFWPPTGFNELSEVRVKLPFILIGKSTIAFFKGQSWRVLNSLWRPKAVSPQGTHTIGLCSRLLFYSKCTGFTVCFTYSDISLTMYINQW